MASLKFIMDMDDDPEPPQKPPQTNKRDGDGATASALSRDHDSTRSALTSYANPQEERDRLTSASSSSTRRRGLSNRPSRSSTPAPSPSSSSTRPALARQQSTDSIDSMDPSGYGGQGQNSSMAPSNVPIRPLVSGSGSETPVRLTPITGRVSRAKKGMPVHICEICRPPKTFTRAEHLRRHQLSHKTPGYPCNWPGCDRAFHRPDLLARHAQRHEQEDKGKGSSEGQAIRRESTTSTEGYAMNTMSQGHSPMLGGPNAGATMNASPGMSGSAYTSHISPYPMSNPGSGRGHTPMSPSQNPGQHEGEQQDPSGSDSGYVLASNPHMSSIMGSSSFVGSSMTATGFGLAFDQPRTTSDDYPNIYLGSQGLSQDLPSLTIPESGVPGLLAPSDSPWPSSASDSNFSTPDEASQGRNLIRSFHSPTSDWPGTGIMSPYPSSSQDAISTSPYVLSTYTSSPHHFGSMGVHMQQYQDEHTTILDHAHQHQPYSSPVRSLSPPTILASAQTAENLVTASVPFRSTPMVGRFKGAALLGPLSGIAASLSAFSLPWSVRNAIPEYLELYWKHCDTLFPLVHRRVVNSSDELLRCAMAAMATQFLPGKEDHIAGNQLHEFAWHEVKRIPQWSVQVMQTILLCEFYARFRGRKVVIRPSQQFRNLYSRVAESHTPTDQIPAAATREERWDRWIEAESHRRLLASCFLLDVHASVYQEQTPITQFSTPIPPIPIMQYNNHLWRAKTPEVWDNRISTRMGPASLDQVTLTPEAMSTAPPMDRAMYLASEFLRLPKRTDAPSLNFEVEVDRSSIERIRSLFPGSPVANTYLALHYTPLQDLLAVSGDSWLFTQKVLPAENFHQRRKRLKRWSSSQHAGAAAGFAAKALLYFFDPNTTTSTTTTINDDNEGTDRSTDADILDDEEDDTCVRSYDCISDYWSMYVCALICWAISHHAPRKGVSGAGGATTSIVSTPDNVNVVGKKGCDGRRDGGEGYGAMEWLRTVAGLDPGDVLEARGRMETIGVIGMVRKRLEGEAVGNKSKLLVDALGVLKKLEEGINWKWF